MSNKRDLDEVMNNLKQLVILYGEVTDELIANLDERNRLLEEANNDIDRLREENERLVNDYNNLDEENNKKIAKIAELKQKKTPSIEAITDLMNELQKMLMKATNKSDKQDPDEGEDDKGTNESEGESETPPVFDLSKDKASDEDKFNPVINNVIKER